MIAWREDAANGQKMTGRTVLILFANNSKTTQIDGNEC